MNCAKVVATAVYQNFSKVGRVSRSISSTSARAATRQLSQPANLNLNNPSSTPPAADKKMLEANKNFLECRGFVCPLVGPSR